MAERNPGLWDHPARDDPARDDPAPDAGDDLADQPAQDAALGIAARHALHDEELIAAFAGDGLEDESEMERAQALVARCTACRDLHRDIALIGVALRAAGTAADVGARTSAPRDFRLTLETAAQLRPGAWLRPAAASQRVGLRERLVGALLDVGRPLGASLAALGIVGVLVGTIGFGAGGYALSAGPGASSGAVVDETIEIGEATEGRPVESGRTSPYEPTATKREGTDTETPGTTSGPGPSALAWLLGGSGGLIALGVLLFALAVRTRPRRQHDPAAGS